MSNGIFAIPIGVPGGHKSLNRAQRPVVQTVLPVTGSTVQFSELGSDLGTTSASVTVGLFTIGAGCLEVYASWGGLDSAAGVGLDVSATASVVCGSDWVWLWESGASEQAEISSTNESVAIYRIFIAFSDVRYVAA